MTPAPAIVLDVTDKYGRQYRIHRSGGLKEYTIGRGYEAYYPHPSTILIPDPMVSRKHCSITWDNADSWLLKDVGSTNGTIVNGEMLKDVYPLRHGSEFKIGGCSLKLEFEPQQAPELAETVVMSSGGEGSMDESDAAETVVMPSGDEGTGLESGAAETVVISSGDEGAGLESDAGQTVVMSSSDEGDMVEAGAAETVVMASEEGDMAESRMAETVVMRSDGESIGPESDAAETVVMPSDAEGAGPASDAAETVVMPSGDDGESAKSDVAETVAIPSDGVAAGFDADFSDTVLMPSGGKRESVTGDTSETVLMPSGDDAASGGEARADETVIGADDNDSVTGPGSPGQSVPESRAGTKEAADKQGTSRVRLRGVIADMVDAGLFDETRAIEYLTRARENGETFFDRLVRDHRIGNIGEIFTWVSEYLGCDHFTDVELLLELVREEEWLPVSVAERRGVVMIQPETNGTVRYATIYPFDIVLHDWVERCAGQKAEIATVLPSVFREAINRLRNNPTDDEDDTQTIPIVIPYDEEQRIRDTLDTQAVPRIVEFFLHRAYVQHASDIHVEPTEAGLLVRNRVDGMLHEENLLPQSLQRAVTSRIKILANMDVAERRRPQDGRISVKINDVPIDIRASSYPTVHGEKIVMRLLDKTTLSPTPDDLGLSERELQKLIDKINAPLGLIMLSGPTGSGKTTTLYSCLGSIDRRTKNVLTVEDPVEYQLDGVHQMQVNEKIGLTFAAGMRTILRQDPDVIMVGECRDDETASMAIQASLTGHVVFSTIHSNDAIGVVTRLLDMDIDPFLVSSALTLAIAQRLLRTVCKNCKMPVKGEEILRKLYHDGVSDEKLANLGIEIDPDLDYVNPAGCRVCRDTGYVGRRAVFEIFEMTNECRQIVMSNDFNPSNLEAVARKNGMKTLVQNALHMVEEGETTHAEVIRVLGERFI